MISAVISIYFRVLIVDVSLLENSLVKQCLRFLAKLQSDSPTDWLIWFSDSLVCRIFHRVKSPVAREQGVAVRELWGDT